MKIRMKLVYKYMAIFYIFPPTPSHLHSLQVENCDSNSRLVVNEDDNVKSGLKGLTSLLWPRLTKNHMTPLWSILNPLHVGASRDYCQQTGAIN